MSTLSQELSAEFVRRYWTEESVLPKHERLRAAFADSIADGFWTAGMRLPTEAELVSCMPCSLGTIQRALRSLADEGFIERRRGSGSTVADLGARIPDPWHMRYRDPQEGGSGYLPVETHVIGRQVLEQQGRWSTAIQQRDEAVIKIDRIFSMGPRIDVYAEFFAIAKRFPELAELEESKLNGVNFKKLIALRYRAPVHRVRQRLRFETPPAHVLAQGGYSAERPGPVYNVVALALNGEPVYYQDFYLPLTEGELDLGFATRA